MGRKFQQSIDKKFDHPMGEPVEGRWFAFVEVSERVTYHTLKINAPNEEAARKEAKRMIANGELQVCSVTQSDVKVNCRPLREKHLVEEEAERRKIRNAKST